MLIAVTLLSALPAQQWWVRMGDFPRAQIAALSVLVLAAYAPLCRPRGSVELVFLLALVAAVAYQGAMMLPYTRLWPVQVQRAGRPSPERTLTLLLANVQQENRRAEGLLRQIDEADPDVVVAIETDDWWLDRLRVLASGRPHTVFAPLDNTYGMLLFSRLELVDPRVEFLVEDDVPSLHAGVRLPGGAVVELHCVHPRPPAPGENPRSTERDAELLVVGRAVADVPGPVVVAGDLNDVAWSYTTRLFQKVSGLLDPRIGRGFLNTFHARNPLVRWPLDHVFHSGHFRLVALERGRYFGSDHFPVCLALSYEPEAGGEHREPEAEPHEEGEAVDRIDRALREDGRTVREVENEVTGA